jgi:hypothetical protein
MKNLFGYTFEKAVNPLNVSALLLMSKMAWL